MPTYEYWCNDDAHHTGCGHKWEEYNIPIEERMVPMNEPCPECGKKDQICRVPHINLHHGVVNPKKKMGGEFCETMERIHKEHPEAQSSYF